AKKRYKSILNKTGSLAQNFPDLLSEWDYKKNDVLPQDITAGSGKKIWWKCKVCGHEWKTSVSHRTSRHGGCPCCSNKVTIRGKNDIATTHPELLNEWNFEKNSITPYEIVAGSGKKVWWKCKSCGYEWFSSMYTRSNGCGCPNCAKEKRKISKSNTN
ncbi:MAG: zinc-ribbon domain-containing protein, partial [Clostridia bacterium]|nr:zinc-ribbon domain-containing protein [Clostridia bacterium]